MTDAQTTAMTPARQFRDLSTRLAGSLLADWVGKDRAGEATGRIAAAMTAAAASARKPEEFYACTKASVANCVAISALTGIMPATGAGALAYLIPQRPRSNAQPELTYNLSHRGVNALAVRSKMMMVPIPVSVRENIEDDGSGGVRIVDRNLDDPPTEMDDLRGVVLLVKDLDSGRVIHSGWVPKKLILARRAKSRSFNAQRNSSSPWVTQPVEMAMKTAMHYAIGRGWCIIDDTDAQRALSIDSTADVIVDDGATALLGSVNGLAESLKDATPDPEPAPDTANEDTVEEKPPVQQCPKTVAEFQELLDAAKTRAEAEALRDLIQMAAMLTEHDKQTCFVSLDNVLNAFPE